MSVWSNHGKHHTGWIRSLARAQAAEGLAFKAEMFGERHSKRATYGRPFGRNLVPASRFELLTPRV